MSKKQYAFCLTISAILAAAGIILVVTAFTQPPAYLCLPAGLLLIIFSIMGALASKQERATRESIEWIKNTQAKTSSNDSTNDSTESTNNSTESNESTQANNQKKPTV